MRLAQFSSILLPQANAIHNLPVGFRSSLVALRSGSFDMDGANSYPESKIVSATFWVSVNTVDSTISNIDTYIDNLYSEAALGRKRLYAEMRDGSLRYADAKLLQATARPQASLYIPDSITANLDGYEQFSVTFELAYPYWRTVGDSGLFADTGLLADTGLFADTSAKSTTVSLATGTTNFTITNDGGVAHYDTTFVITPDAGSSLTNITINNLTTGESLTWTGTLAAGEVLTIQTLAQTIDKDGTGEYANTALGANQLGFWSLALGENNFSVAVSSDTGTGGEGVFTWERHWIR